MLILSLFLSILVTLFMVNKKVNIGYSLITGSILLALLNGRGISRIYQLFIQTITESTTIALAITIGLITVLAYLMEKYLILDRMIVALEKILRSTKATILIAPALMGTLLVSGGALMSCPIVGSLGDRLSIPNDKKATINLIFRHALYFVFPLSPTILLAAEIGNFELWDFIKLQFPIALALYIFGYFYLLRGLKDPKTEKISVGQYFSAIKEFVLYSSPIMISLFGVVLFQLPFYISLIAGILASILINQYDTRQDEKYALKENVFKTIYKGIKFPMIIAIVGIMLYKNTVNDVDEIIIFLNNLLDQGMPIELLILMSTAIICFPLASTNPGIAILFPMILPLAPNYETKLLYAMFIYTSSFLFYYISPLHLCQVLTLEYFEVKLKSLYKNYLYLLPITYGVMVMVYFVMK
ncbi:DUF401 family protein [Alkaliphilus hydrothermalis]|uniref:Integral membrane protein (TIGR00529 family) n=1 Tax=Alkaliphilus hydrothermalis TaxID=1482730 RepID=A0ABS2NMY8_9FIRM|nr:DUF401 family protein [Alkaliphilus hydrothermalis]MBM7614311.1 integral membrane protein (TIGR00529 family) [Alkaliphilus hydrothermalis]